MSLDLEYEPDLVEAAVLEALRGHPEEPRFRRERDPIYEIPDTEARDAEFRHLGVRWFERLALAEPLDLALGEAPNVTAGCGRAIVGRARTARDEVADLRVGSSGRPTLLIRLRAETLARRDRALPVLRHELAHVADMLDPAFGYEPRLAAGSAREPLLRDRYRALWDTLIDGRLSRLGRAPASARIDRWRDFIRAFPELGEGAEAAFARFWDGPRPAHADLLAFAAGEADGTRRPECPLCRLPARDFEPEPETLPEAVATAIAGDFPWWTPDAGLCRRCAELYRARVSIGA